MPRPKLPIDKQKARFCISVPRPLADRMDRIFTNRSAAIVQAVTHYLDNLDDIDLIRAELLRTAEALAAEQAEQAEIARLRKALEEIAEKCGAFDSCPVGPATIAGIARDTLEVKG